MRNPWEAPERLTGRPTPRPVRLTREAKAGQIVGLVAMTFFWSIVGVVLWVDGTECAVRWALARDGVTVPARVSGKKVSNSKGGPYYYVAYDFAAADGSSPQRSYRREAKVPYSVYERARQGSWLTADYAPRYAPTDPATSRLPLEEMPVGWISLTFSLAVFGGLGLFTVANLLAVRRNLRRLVQWQTAGARVTAIRPTVLGAQKIHYEFRDRAGRLAGGSAVTRSVLTFWRFAPSPDPGQTLTVFYDEQKPRRNVAWLTVDFTPFRFEESASFQADRNAAQARLLKELAKFDYKARRDVPASDSIWVDDDGKLQEDMYEMAIQTGVLLKADRTTKVSSVKIYDHGLQVFFESDTCAMINLAADGVDVPRLTLQQLTAFAKTSIGALFTTVEPGNRV